MSAVAVAMGISIRNGVITAEGEMDFRGTLGVDKTVPAGFTDIHLLFEVESDATLEQLEKLLSLTERYCVVYQTFVRAPKITSSITPARS